MTGVGEEWGVFHNLGLGYITVMAKETPHIKTLMVSHLQELMEDREHYRWLAVMAYHAA